MTGIREMEFQGTQVPRSAQLRVLETFMWECKDADPWGTSDREQVAKSSYKNIAEERNCNIISSAQMDRDGVSMFLIPTDCEVIDGPLARNSGSIGIRL